MKRMSGDKIVRALGNIRKAVQELEDAFFEDQPKGDGDPADGMDEGSVGPMRAGFTTSASPHPLAFGQRFKGPLKRFRERIVQEAVENGIPESEAVETVAAIEGETSATAGDAKKAWDKACKDWKKELKTEHGKDLISADCGEKICSGDAGSKVCSSKGLFKLKVR
jgi:hypothetical protein